MPLGTGMAEKTLSADGDGPHRDVPRLAQRVAVAAAIVSAIILLYPVIASPITADDRYWYLWTTASSDGSIVDLLRYSWERLSWRVDYGRVNLLTEVERRLSGLGIMEAAVATSTPIPVYQALLKLGLLGGGILTVLAFVRSLRWRASDGTLVRVSRRSLVLVGVAGTLAVAVGAQATVPGRNGWTAYPVSTYGAVISIFGSIALLLWLTRLVAERSRAMAISATVVLALLAVTTSFRYELVFPAVPIAAVALIIVPVTDQAHRAAGRRAKLVTGLAYVGTFIPVFIATRLYLAGVCADRSCYSGVQMELGADAARTAVYNFLSAIPGAGDNELLADLDQVGWADRYPVLPDWWSVLAGVLALVALWMVWWAARRREPASNEPGDTPTRPSVQQRAEARLLSVGAGLALLVALGAAVVMGLGSRSHELITGPGEPYRNIVVTWTGLAFCVVLVIVALGVIWPQRSALVAWATLAIVVGTVAALMLPGNLMALRAARITHSVTDAINWEVVKGDTTQSGETRRCELYARIDHDVVAYAREPLKTHSNTAFEIYHGQPFCSDLGQSGDSS
jgi:hypothetical protein